MAHRLANWVRFDPDAARKGLLKAIEECGGNKSEAARRLGTSVRTLRRWLTETAPPELCESRCSKCGQPVTVQRYETTEGETVYGTPEGRRMHVCGPQP